MCINTKPISIVDQCRTHYTSLGIDRNGRLQGDLPVAAGFDVYHDLEGLAISDCIFRAGKSTPEIHRNTIYVYYIYIHDQLFYVLF